MDSIYEKISKIFLKIHVIYVVKHLIVMHRDLFYTTIK